MNYTNKEQYIQALINAMTRCGVTDQREILTDFEQHFADGAAAGESEAQVCEKLGDPEEIAKQYASEDFPAIRQYTNLCCGCRVGHSSRTEYVVRTAARSAERLSYSDGRCYRSCLRRYFCVQLGDTGARERNNRTLFDGRGTCRRGARLVYRRRCGGRFRSPRLALYLLQPRFNSASRRCSGFGFIAACRTVCCGGTRFHKYLYKYNQLAQPYARRQKCPRVYRKKG